MRTSLANLDALVGSQSAGQFATAYEVVLLTVSNGHLDRMPDRDARSAIFEAMLAAGRAFGFEAERLAEAGVAAVSRLHTSPIKGLRPSVECAPLPERDTEIINSEATPNLVLDLD